MADSPDKYLGKASRPESDHVLMEPSHMTETAVNDWLTHWLACQNSGKRGLVLKNPSAVNAKPQTQRQRGKGKGKGKGRYIEPDDEGEDEEDDPNVEEDEGEDNGLNDEGEQGPNDVEQDANNAGPSIPPGNRTKISDNDGKTVLTAASCGKGRKARRTFLESLSDDINYRRLLLLLDIASVWIHYMKLFFELLTVIQEGPLSGPPSPDWASWEFSDSYLPPAFHRVKGTGSLSDLLSWLGHEPSVGEDNNLASYRTVERVVLSIGLAMRDLSAKQFKEDSELPRHVVKSPFEFRHHENLSHVAENLVSGFEDL
jgi:hypothetical protein